MMKPIFSGCKAPLRPWYIYDHEQFWRDQLDKILCGSRKKKKFIRWIDLTDEEQKKYKKKAEQIRTEEQLHDYLHIIKDQREFERLSKKAIKHKKIKKRNKKQ